MKYNKFVKKTPHVIRCPDCSSDNVYYDADVTHSSWEGNREITGTGQYTCLDCNHFWYRPQAAHKPAEAIPVDPES